MAYVGQYAAASDPASTLNKQLVAAIIKAAAHIYAASRPWLAFAAMAAGVLIVLLAFIVP